MKCVLCHERSGKRHCPGVRGYICPLCCGKEREVSIACPFDCVHLQEAYRHEGQHAEPPEQVVFPSHEVSRDFVEEHGEFLARLSVFLIGYGSRYPDTKDADLRTALHALVQTYDTLAKGLIYETQPEDPLGRHLFREARDFIEEWRKQKTNALGLPALRDGDVLRSLVFLARLAQRYDNRRPRGRSFLAYLCRQFPGVKERQASSIIVPGA